MAELVQSVSFEFEKLTEELELIIQDEVVALQSELIVIGEKIHVTRNFKNSWTDVKKLGDMSWEFFNKADYASILARGRRGQHGGLGWAVKPTRTGSLYGAGNTGATVSSWKESKNRAYGSLGWAEGIDPMIKKLEDTIQKRVDDVRV